MAWAGLNWRKAPGATAGERRTSQEHIERSKSEHDHGRTRDVEKALSPAIVHTLPRTDDGRSRSLVRSAVGDFIESHSLSSAGLGLFYAWAWMLCQSLLFYHGHDPVSMARVYWIVTLLIGQVVWIPILLIKRPGFSLVNHKASLIVMPVLMIVGTIAIATANGDTTAGVVQLYIGVSLAGLGGHGAMPVMWGESYGGMGSRRACVGVGVSTVLAMCVYFAIHNLPSTTLQVMATAALPILSTALLASRRRTAPAPAPAAAAAATGAAPRRSPLRLAVIPAGYGLVYGVVMGMSNFMSETSVTSSGAATVIGSAIGAAVLLVSAIVFSRRLDIVGFTYQMIVPILGVGLALLPLAGHPIFAKGLVLSGFLLFDLIMYAILSDVSFRLGHPAVKVFSLGRSMSHGGILVGILVGRLITATVSLDQRALVTVSLVLLYVLIFALAIALNDRSVMSGWGFAPIVAAETVAVSSEEEPETIVPGCRELAEACKLSKREEEVLGLLAQGRNLKHIEKALFISEGTTRYHVRNIYHKIGVHSRQELFDRIEVCVRPGGEPPEKPSENQGSRAKRNSSAAET